MPLQSFSGLLSYHFRRLGISCTSTMGDYHKVALMVLVCHLWCWTTSGQFALIVWQRTEHSAEYVPLTTLLRVLESPSILIGVVSGILNNPSQPSGANTLCIT